jgi:hypothetical protein
MYYAKVTNLETLQYLGYLSIIPALGFFVIYFGNLRKTGIETGGNIIWWNDLRPVHGLLYSLFAYNAIMKNSSSWIYILIDVIIGFTSFIVYHVNAERVLNITRSFTEKTLEIS